MRRTSDQIEPREVIRSIPIVAFASAIVLINMGCSKIDPSPPDFNSMELQPVSASRSTITLPFSIPIKSIRSELEDGIPKSDRGTKRKKLLVGSASVDWKYSREPISVSGKNNRLTASTSLSADIEFKGVRLVGVGGTITLGVRPQFMSNWRVRPNIDTSVKLSRARIAGISVRSLVRGDIKRLVQNKVRAIENSISNDLFLEQAVSEQWMKVCQSFPIEPKSGVWLEVRPVSIRAAQPAIDPEEIRLQLSLDVETKVVDEPTDFNCPFPTTLELEESSAGSFEIVLPAIIDYGTLEGFLEQEYEGKTIGEDLQTTIHSISLYQDRDALILAFRLTMKAKGWFGRSARGTVYVSAKPRLSVHTQEVILSDFQLDIESRNALLSVLGDLAETALFLAIGDEVAYELSPVLDETRTRAEQALAGISKDGIRVVGSVDEIRVTDLQVGPDKLRVVVSSKGEISASSQSISWASN